MNPDTIDGGDLQLAPVNTGQLEAITRGEIDVQIATAHKYPRSITLFKERALAMACCDEETAASCIYVRPVGKEKNEKTGKWEPKYAEGLSIRAAEIVGASYGNLRVGAMIIEQTPERVVCRGYAHDLETNFAATSETVEITVKSDGSPYSQRQAAVVAKAALSKALRDATFRVVPRAMFKSIENEVRALIAGDSKSFDQRKAAVVQWTQRLGIDTARVWDALGIDGPDDLLPEHLLTLTGLKTSIRDKEVSIDEAFPVVTQGKVGAPADTGTPKSQSTNTGTPPADDAAVAAAKKAAADAKKAAKAAQAAQKPPAETPAANQEPAQQPAAEQKAVTPAMAQGDAQSDAGERMAAAKKAEEKKEQPAAKAPTADELRKGILVKTNVKNIGKGRLMTTLREKGMVSADAEFSELDAATLLAVSDAIDDIIHEILNPA